MFRLRQLTDSREIECIIGITLSSCEAFNIPGLDLNYFKNFTIAIQNGYKNLTYHNSTHAADVCQSIYFVLKEGGRLAETANVDALEMFAILTAAIVHDFEHPGVQNVFLQRMLDPKAIRHNDVSILESHHVAAAFELMLSDPQFNWAKEMATEDFTRVRQLMIDMVLTTDMSFHFRELNQLKERLAKQEFNPSESEKDKLIILKNAFHLSDISNPAKSFYLYKDWTDLLFFEFFAQGDLERLQGFPISQFCDRHTTNVAKS